MSSRSSVEQRFAGVFAHLALIVAYAQRRDARDPEAIGAEVMMIAWRRLADVPVDDPRPWLIATARNLVMAEYRNARGERTAVESLARVADDALNPSADMGLEPSLSAGLRRLPTADREALLLVAWEALTPKAAAASLGISTIAFRARLHRARRRLAAEMRITTDQQRLGSVQTEMGVK